MWFKKYIDRYASVPSHCSPMCVNCTLIYTKQVEFGLWTCRMFENKGYWTSWVKLQNSEQGQKPLNHLGDFFFNIFCWPHREFFSHGICWHFQFNKCNFINKSNHLTSRAHMFYPVEQMPTRVFEHWLGRFNKCIFSTMPKIFYRKGAHFLSYGNNYSILVGLFFFKNWTGRLNFSSKVLCKKDIWPPGNIFYLLC